MRKISFWTVILVLLVISVGCSKSKPNIWEQNRVMDGEGLIYHCDRLIIKRPTSDPFPLISGEVYHYYIDSHGNHVEQMDFEGYDKAWKFTEELGAASRDGKWGFLDREMNYQIEPIFDWAEPFFGGLAAVKLDGLYGYIDRSGSFVIEPKYLNARFFCKGLAPVLDDKGWHYINSKGEVIIPGPFKRSESFSSIVGLAAVQIDSLWGFVDISGNMVIDAIYEDVWAFSIRSSEPVAAVKIDGKWSYIKAP